MSGDEILTGLLGHPVAHSKSPLIHNHWIKENGLRGTYTAFDVAPEDLEMKVRELRAEGYAGFNLTVPHKEAIIPFCDELDEPAQICGAVNTIVLQGDKMLGRNTDVFGFIENVRQSQPDFALDKGAGIILGAGGAARAAVYALLKEGSPEVFIANRTASKAEAIAQSSIDPSRVTVVPWEERDNALAGVSLLVNTTTLGMDGHDALTIDLDALSMDTCVYDIVYAPLMTDLLHRAQERGSPIVTGIGMLLHQARPAFQAWYGAIPDVTSELEKMVLS